MSSICRVLLQGVPFFRHKGSVYVSEFGTPKEGLPKGSQHASAILFMYAEGSPQRLRSCFPNKRSLRQQVQATKSPTFFPR